MNVTFAMLSWLGIGIGGLFVSAGLILAVFWIWALVNCAKRVAAGENGLVGWLIAICFLHVLGALAYVIFAGRRSSTAPAQML